MTTDDDKNANRRQKDINGPTIRKKEGRVEEKKEKKTSSHEWTPRVPTEIIVPHDHLGSSAYTPPQKWYDASNL